MSNDEMGPLEAAVLTTRMRVPKDKYVQAAREYDEEEQRAFTKWASEHWPHHAGLSVFEATKRELASLRARLAESERDAERWREVARLLNQPGMTDERLAFACDAIVMPDWRPEKPR